MSAPLYAAGLSRLSLWLLYGLAALAIGLMRRERRAIEDGYYRNLSQVLAELLKMGSLARGPLQQRVRYRNPQLVRELIAAGHSVLLLCAHQCNWEWQLLALSLQLQVPVQAAYRPLRGAGRLALVTPPLDTRAAELNAR